MNLNEFIDRFGAAARGRAHLDGNAIRIGGGSKPDCPVSAVTGNNDDFLMPVTACREQLGMTEHLAVRIVNAADGTPPCDYRLRARLLRAAGLEEEK